VIEVTGFMAVIRGGVTFLPLVTSMSVADAVRMELVLLALFVLLGVASALGLVTDSRDGADWRPTDEGRRVSSSC
jgi:hypothetical protein